MRTLPHRLSVGLLGGTGFIGRHLAARLVRDGHDVTVLTRNRERHRDLLVLPTLRLVEGDAHDLPTLHAAFGGCDAIVNLAGTVTGRGRHGAASQRANAGLATAALQACRSSGQRRYLQVSALKAAVGAPSLFLRSNGEADAQVVDSGLEWTILRPSVVYGPDDRFINRIADHLGGLPVLLLPRANARMAPVFVGDVAGAVLRVLNDPRTIGKTLQLCGPKVYSIREIAELTAKIKGRRRPIWRLTPTIGRLMARALDFAADSPFSTDMFLSLSEHSICDSSAPGFSALGMEPVSLEAILPLYQRQNAD